MVLVASTISPRCPGFSWYNSARLKPVIDAISFKLEPAGTPTSLKCGRFAMGGKFTPYLCGDLIICATAMKRGT